MSVEQSGHQDWLYEPGTTDPLDETEFDAFGERTLITPPVEPALAAPTYEAPGRHHAPSWAHEPYTEVPAFTAPIHTLEPAFGEPMYAQLFLETHPEAAASQARPAREQAPASVQVMSLQDRGPLVKDGEPGSIFDTLNKELSDPRKDYYAELRRPYYSRPPSFEHMADTATAQLAPAPVRREITAPVVEAPQEIAVITPVEAIDPETPRTVITIKGEQEDSITAVIEEEQSGLGKQEAAAFLTRVLRGLEKSRDEDLAAEAAQQAAEAKAVEEVEARAEDERLAAEAELARDVAIIEAAAPQEQPAEAATTVEQTPTVVHEERLTLSGLRDAAKEVLANHKKAARIAEYAGAAVIAVAAGRRLLGRFRRR